MIIIILVRYQAVYWNLNAHKLFSLRAAKSTRKRYYPWKQWTLYLVNLLWMKKKMGGKDDKESYLSISHPRSPISHSLTKINSHRDTGLGQIHPTTLQSLSQWCQQPVRIDNPEQRNLVHGLYLLPAYINQSKTTISWPVHEATQACSNVDELVQMKVKRKESKSQKVI